MKSKKQLRIGLHPVVIFLLYNTSMGLFTIITTFRVVCQTKFLLFFYCAGSGSILRGQVKYFV